MIRDKSASYHLAMADQYLYNATRSLAASQGQLKEFKTWVHEAPRDHRSYLHTLTKWYMEERWPWEKNDGKDGEPDRYD